jgi:hypothetical protein
MLLKSGFARPAALIVAIVATLAIEIAPAASAAT